MSRVAREIFETSDLALLLDEVSSTLTYICKAEPGTATSAAKWQIKRLLKSGVVTRGEFADGDTKFDNVADDRNTAVVYS